MSQSKENQEPVCLKRTSTCPESPFVDELVKSSKKLKLDDKPVTEDVSDEEDNTAEATGVAAEPVEAAEATEPTQVSVTTTAAEAEEVAEEPVVSNEDAEEKGGEGGSNVAEEIVGA
jgi:hypothetical protein